MKIAFIGSHGVGKTTLARLLLGRVEPDAGEVVVTWPPSDLADYWGLSLEDAQMLTNCFAPIAESGGLDREHV